MELFPTIFVSFRHEFFRVAFVAKRVTMCVLEYLPQRSHSMKKELRKQIQQLEQKMAKSQNNMDNGGSHFLYHREQMIRFKLMQAGISQKKLAKHLNLTESYISKLITGERYNQDFEIFLRKFLQFDYCFI